MSCKLLLPILFVLLALALPHPALADGIIIPEPPVPGPFPIRQLEIRYHRVTVTIENQVAITHVDQVFYNPNSYPIEGEYLFPLPAGAVVNDFKLWIDNEPISGQVLSAEEARRIYEDIVRKLIDPALLEYVDRGAVRARIFPIPPQGERRIELEYTQVLQADNGLVRYLYPLSTEKFSRTPLEQVSISVDIRSTTPLRAVYSPSHPIGVSRDGDFHATAGYEEKDILPDQDFALYYSTGDTEAFHLLTYRDPQDSTDPDGFYLLLLAPRPILQDRIVPKDVILVLDRSGSMEGEKFQQAQQALVYILRQLNPEDHFNVLTFSTGVELFAPRLQPADQAEAAVQWVQASSARGSTDINRALLEALALANTERPTYLLFLTDGLPTEGEINSTRILDNFRQAASRNVRLFAFGVGYDVDTFLLDSLAQDQGGTTTYVLPGENVNEAVSGLYEKISTPVLTDLRLSVEGVSLYDSYPNPLPDLFVGSQVIAVGRYREGGTATVTLTGQLDGETQVFTYPGQVFTARTIGSNLNNSIESALPRLWATRKIGALLNDIRLNGPDQETIDQVVRLSIRYGIVTPYTSYLVTEPTALGAEAQERIANQAYQDLAAAPAAPSSGQAAVEKSMQQSQLAEAQVGAAPSLETRDQVKVAGSRTYLLVGDTWTDTAFDPDTMTVVKVPFLSPDYFALLAAYPELGPAFALGERVIAFAGGSPYEVVPSGEQTAPVQIPPTALPDNPSQPYPIQPGPAQPPTAYPLGTPAPAEPTQPRLPCLGGLFPLLLAPLFALVFSRRPRRP